jgi:hypothetical protein
MKIAENLQIKGLATSSKRLKGIDESVGEGSEKEAEAKSTKRPLDTDDNSSNSSAKAVKSMKMEADEDVTDLTNDEECEAQSNEDLLLTIPEITMVESRPSDTNNSKMKEDGLHRMVPHPQQLNLFSPYEYSPEALLAETQSKSADPSLNNSGSNVTMLSSTSLLHGNCIFNRNNTVATQQGLKTYWLCKSYRISMCKARCITHQGKVISATGIHNHIAHMTKQEIPPGHTPNVVQPPPPMSEFNPNVMPSTSAATHHHSHQNPISHILPQPYQYLQHTMHENHVEQLHRPLQITNVQSLDNKMTFSDGSSFKLEHQI